MPDPAMPLRVLHVSDLITTAPRFHYAAILLVTIGFAVLTTASVAQEAFSGPHDRGGKRLVGANPITDCVMANGGQGTVTSKTPEAATRWLRYTSEQRK